MAKFYNYCFFGNGHHFYVPVFWIFSYCILTIAYLYYRSVRDPFSIVYHVALAVELVVNVLFGYEYCRQRKFAKIILYYQQKYRFSNALIFRYLKAMSYLLLLCLIYLDGVIIISYFLDPGNEFHGSLADYFDLITSLICMVLVYGASLYLCILWILQLWMVRHCCEAYFGTVMQLPTSTSQQSQPCSPTTPLTTQTSFVPSPSSPKDKNMIPPSINPLQTTNLSNSPTNALCQHCAQPLHRTTTSNTTSCIDSLDTLFPQQHIEKVLIEYLEEMRSLSDEWFWNHLIRTITGLVIIIYATIQTHEAVQSSTGTISIMKYSFIVVVYYCIIWFTALSTGYVNDYFFKFNLRQITKMYAYHGKAEPDLDSRIMSTSSRIALLRGVDGLHFAGFILSVEKAVSVGSIIASILIFCINWFQ